MNTVKNIVLKQSVDIKKSIFMLLLTGLSVTNVAKELNIDADTVEDVINEVKVDPNSFQEFVSTYSRESIYDTSDKKAPIFVSATIYHATEHQTDSTPMITADNTDLNNIDINKYKIIAVSRDLLYINGGPLKFGDTVLVTGAGPMDGIWHVHDVMNARYTNHIDFLVDSSVKSGRWENVELTIL